MVSATTLFAGAAALYAVFVYVNGLRKNIADARKAALPYIVVPVSPINRAFQITARFWLPLIRLLPQRLWQDWIFVLEADWAYRHLHEPWGRLGETFLVVAPGHILLYTQSAEAIRQITSRREDFPKPTHAYDILEIYGRNVVTIEGSLWRLHRKITSASFNEKNAAHTFAEAIHQTQGMLTKWLGPDGRASDAIRTLEQDTMTLALNVIGSVGFGLRFLWPGQTLPSDMDPRMHKYSSLVPPPGYSMAFPASLAAVLHRIIPLVVAPKWLLRILPFRWAKEAYEATVNYERYMEELLRDTIEEVQSGHEPERGMDIMGSLVRAKYGAGKGAGGAGGPNTLTDSEIIGNAFVMMLAGHETTANTLHFTLLELANNPAAQRAVQADVDRIFGATDPSTWAYEHSINALQASYVGAAMNETLRLLPSVMDIPKWVPPSQSQVLVVDGTKHVLPGGLIIALNAMGAQRNPRSWPGRPSRLTGDETDLNDFVPERWFRTAESAAGDDDDDDEGEDYGGFRGPDTSAALFRPARGSFIPFSEGARSCLGRRIALVEIIAALAVVFQRYSVELAVDDWAGDAEVDRMPRVERAKLYQRAQARSRATIRGAQSVVTLKLHGQAHVPVRLVRRGEERFVDFMDP